MRLKVISFGLERPSPLLVLSPPAAIQATVWIADHNAIVILRLLTAARNTWSQLDGEKVKPETITANLPCNCPDPIVVRQPDSTGAHGIVSLTQVETLEWVEQPDASVTSVTAYLQVVKDKFIVLASNTKVLVEYCNTLNSHIDALKSKLARSGASPEDGESFDGSGEGAGEPVLLEYDQSDPQVDTDVSHDGSDQNHKLADSTRNERSTKVNPGWKVASLLWP